MQQGKERTQRKYNSISKQEKIEKSHAFSFFSSSLSFYLNCFVVLFISLSFPSSFEHSL